MIALPPLRERREDIPELVSYFLRRYGKELGAANPSIQPEAIELLSEQTWPGNVRELENVVRKALLLARGYAIGVEEIRRALDSPARPGPSGSTPLAGYVAELLAAATRDEMENLRAVLFEAADRELFSQAIKLAHGNQARAARWLGVSRLTMREKLTHFGLHPAQEQSEVSAGNEIRNGGLDPNTKFRTGS